MTTHLRSRQWALCLIVTCLVGQASAQDLADSKRKQVLIAQDTRDQRALRPFFTDRDSTIRRRAALAAGSVQDTSHTPYLMRLLDDRVADVRKAAVFALGQMTYVVDSLHRRHISSVLQRHLDEETDGEAALKCAEALGKIGDAQSLAGLMQPSEQRRPFPIEWEIALSVGRYAYRNIKSKDATAYVVRLLDSSTGRDRWKAAHALMRIADTEFLDEHVSRIAAAAQSQDAEVRMHVASALGRLSDKRVAELTLLRLIQDDPDWRVRVNAIKTLSTAKDAISEGLGLAVVQAMDDPDEHISVTALGTVRALKLNEGIAGIARTSLAAVIENSAGRYTSRQQREAAISVATLGGEHAHKQLSERKDQGRLPLIAYVEALGAIPSEEARDELLSYIRPVGPKLTRVALDGLQASVKRVPLSPRAAEKIRMGVVAALVFDDLAVLTTAATLLGDSLLADAGSVPELLVALQRLKSPDDVEPMVAIIQTLGKLQDRIALPALVSLIDDPDRTVALEAATALEKITGDPYRHLVAQHTKALHINYDWDMLEWIRHYPEVLVRTSRGEFTITMLPDEAPFTCINFATLIRKNFFDSLTFHRVVPNFVVQGGDPRGDGWGGPGYAIRSEFGLANYGRGYVGVASAGKDTEGCQLFVTHSPQPHLDGRYTIFGRVISGMDVVDRLQVGDVIEEMEFMHDIRTQQRK